jgi:hypothetical protein
MSPGELCCSASVTVREVRTFLLHFVPGCTVSAATRRLKLGKLDVHIGISLLLNASCSDYR